jgi:hypothetical protein
MLKNLEDSYNRFIFAPSNSVACLRRFKLTFKLENEEITSQAVPDN